MAIERRLPNTEILPKTPIFTPETEHKLEEAGCLIYYLREQSVKDLRDAGKPLQSNEGQNHQKIDSNASRGTMVAFNPNQLLLPGSNQKNTVGQFKMVDQYSKILQQRLATRRIQLVPAQLPDWVELTIAHFEATGERLFGSKYDFAFTRTTTSTKMKMFMSEYPTVASLGNFDAEYGLEIRYWSPIYADSEFWVAPLIVPA